MEGVHQNYKENVSLEKISEISNLRKNKPVLGSIENNPQFITKRTVS